MNIISYMNRISIWRLNCAGREILSRELRGRSAEVRFFTNSPLQICRSPNCGHNICVRQGHQHLSQHILSEVFKRREDHGLYHAGSTFTTTKMGRRLTKERRFWIHGPPLSGVVWQTERAVVQKYEELHAVELIFSKVFKGEWSKFRAGRNESEAGGEKRPSIRRSQVQATSSWPRLF